MIFIHYLHKNAVIVAVAQSSNRMYFHIKQTQYQSNNKQQSSAYFNIKLCKLIF